MHGFVDYATFSQEEGYDLVDPNAYIADVAYFYLCAQLEI